MFKEVKAFSGFSVDDIELAKAFYGDTLGLVAEENPAGLMLKVAGTNGVFVYPKEDHQAATYTILNFMVTDIDVAADALIAKGVELETYEGMNQDDKGIARGKAANMGPDIAWFKDPAGNILSILND